MLRDNNKTMKDEMFRLSQRVSRRMSQVCACTLDSLRGGDNVWGLRTGRRTRAYLAWTGDIRLLSMEFDFDVQYEIRSRFYLVFFQVHLTDTVA